MKHLRRTSSSKNNLKPLQPEEMQVHSRLQLKELQTLMASAVFRPLTDDNRMQPQWTDGSSTALVAERFIKPNDRLTSFDRLEIYNRVYWFRVLDCLYDDYPGLRAIVGEKRFMELATAYLTKYPSVSFTLRNLGQRLEKFLCEEPRWLAPHQELGLDMARFEWAQVVAFDDAALPAIATDEVIDTPPSKLRIGLQPYLSLLVLNYAVDRFFVAVQKREADVLRDEASNTFETMPHSKRPRTKLMRLPRRERIHVAVHRYDNSLFYKRLDPEAFAILQSLRRGETVEKACTNAIACSSLKKINWPARIKTWFEDWSSLGWFCQRLK